MDTHRLRSLITGKPAPATRKLGKRLHAVRVGDVRRNDARRVDAGHGAGRAAETKCNQTSKSDYHRHSKTPARFISVESEFASVNVTLADANTAIATKARVKNGTVRRDSLFRDVFIC